MPDMLNIYIKNLKTLTPLTKEREKELFESEITDAAFTELVCGNLGLVVKIAKEYSDAWPNFDIMDLIQEGNIGLMKAITKFDIEKRIRLTTYSAEWIKGGIKRYIQQNQHSVSITKTVAHADMFFKLNKNRSFAESQDLPTDTKAMAKQLNVKENDLREVEPLLFEDGVFSLTDNLGLLDEQDPETLMINKERETRIAKSLSDFSNTLNERQHFIFKRRMIGDSPLTQGELAKILLTTQQNISKIEQGIIRSARKFFSKDDIKDILNHG